MIDRARLLADLQPLVTELEDDLRLRLEEDRASHEKVHGEYLAARNAGRTAHAWETFRDEQLTQVAVAWVLACVFVRFVEDNELVGEPWLSGPGRRLQQSQDRYLAWLRAHPQQTDREYLRTVFAELGRLPGLGAILAPGGHGLVHELGPTADGARRLRTFWLEAGDGGITHDFADPARGTRFLGDLYQDLSQAARKRFALLQTPEFIEAFLLERTLEPALEEFGLAQTRLIDPACGSGHFLLGAFARLLARWQKQEPGTEARVLAERALDAVAGVDLNPFAVAIARFRLLVAALQASGVRRLKDALDFRPRVATGDALLHGRGGMRRQRVLHEEEEAAFAHFYRSEDPELLREIFGRSYHAVVGNPPYITPKDAAANLLYRGRFPEVCYRQYSLGVPFTQLFFELARPGMDEKRAAGFVGMITANSFMKREFGKKLIEEYLASRGELTHVLDLSRAHVPGHDTPTVILLGRARTPVTQTIRAVLGIKGEPSTPENPARGQVWSAILQVVDQPGSENEYVSCSDIERARFARHPWSTGGGGATDLKERISETCEARILDMVDPPIGRAVRIAEEDVFIFPDNRRRYSSALQSEFRGFLVGESIRDWTSSFDRWVWYPYTSGAESSPILTEMWQWRTTLANRSTFQGIMSDSGLRWFDYLQHTSSAYRTSLSIAFAFVATHNHFVLDRGGKVFKQSAPVIKLRVGASEESHLSLLGIMNSSTACFYLKQVSHNKGIRGIAGGITSEAWEQFFEFTATGVGALPVPETVPANVAERLDSAAASLVLLGRECAVLNSSELEEARVKHGVLLSGALALQEELDWECYRLYGLLDDDLTYRADDLPGLQLGQRAFEIVLARDLAAGKTTTTWFQRHGSTPITEIPADWPDAYRALVQRRIDLIASNPDLRLIEQPEYKRRWNTEPWEKQVETAQRRWLLDRMEDARLWAHPHLTTTARFADQLRRDPDFLRVATLYAGPDLDVDALVRDLVTAEGVPFLPVLRYKPSGLRKRAAWERTWDLQRAEDAIDTRTQLPEDDPEHLTEARAKAEKARQVGAIPVPPKYASSDFVKSSFWRLRGKLDVPKERFVLYPSAERDDDPSPVFTWAGFDHLQQARALAEWLLARREQDGWDAARLTPLYAGLQQLVPWLRQWHNDVDPETGQRLGDYFASFLDEELRARGLTAEQVRGWAPPARRAPRRARGADG